MAKHVLMPRSIVPTTGSCRKDAGKSPDPAGILLPISYYFPLHPGRFPPYIVHLGDENICTAIMAVFLKK